MKYNSVLLQVLTQRVQQSLGAQLVGLYVHGSIAFGCFQWQSSDVDLLIVTHSVPTEAQKRALIQAFLELTPLAPPKGLEMSVVLVQDCVHFRFYFVLNLCRVLSYLQNGIVCSKETGGLWALKHLPECWHPLLQQCLTAYRTGSPPQLERRTLLTFCAIMQDNIQRHQSEV